MQDSKLVDTPSRGAWNVLTGANGSGKSRYLGQLADVVIENMLQYKGEKYSKIVCLSGTIFERFPRSAYEASDNDTLIYLGHKTNNNMFSAISPFRRLVPEILRSSDRVPARCKAAENLLMELGLEGRMRIKFNQGKKAEENKYGARISDATIEFSSYSLSIGESWTRIAEGLSTEKIQLSDVQFVKEREWLSLADLSSGERSYILSGLAFCFCAIDNSLILYDEPENSLHPDWQASIIRNLDGILHCIGIMTTVVIATHSPLIAASVPNNNSYICDLRTDRMWKKLNIFGMNADNVLSEQFGLRSARSVQAVDIIQECLTLIANGKEESEEFSLAGKEFLKIDLHLAKEDPLFRATRTIKSIIEARN